MIPQDRIQRKHLLSAELEAMQQGKPIPKAGAISLNVSALGLFNLDETARRYRVSRSQIADLVFSNLHKLRIVDIADAPIPDDETFDDAPEMLPDDEKEGFLKTKYSEA